MWPFYSEPSKNWSRLLAMRYKSWCFVRSLVIPIPSMTLACPRSFISNRLVSSFLICRICTCYFRLLVGRLHIIRLVIDSCCCDWHTNTGRSYCCENQAVNKARMHFCVPLPRRLLESIQRFLQFAYLIRIRRVFETFWDRRVDIFIQVSV